MRFSWIVTLIFILWAPNAYSWSIMPVGAINQGSALFGYTNGHTAGSSVSSYGAGVLFGFRMMPRVFMEVGVLYLTRGFTMEFSGGATTTYQFTTGQIPLAVRIYVLRSVYLGVGGYFAHAIGSVGYSTSAGDAGSKSFTEAACGADDYGGLVALGMKFSLLPFVSIEVDGRYLYGLQNITQLSGATTYFRDIQVLGGIRFGI